MAKPLLHPGEIGHHVFWPRRGYRNNLEHRFRNYNGLVVPTTSDRELHAKLDPPPKPSKAHMWGLMNHLSATPKALESVPYWGIHRAIDYFSVQAIWQHQPLNERDNA